MKGRIVKTLSNESMQQGNHQLIWNTSDENGQAVPAGVYFLKLKAGNINEIKKLIVIK